MARRKKPYRPNPPLTLLLAWLIPGAGHVCIGRPLRGVIIFLVICATFWAGVGIGGVMTVDPRAAGAERWWFVSEMLAGVHGIVGWQRQERVYRKVTSDLPDSIGPFNRAEAESRRVYAVNKALADKGLALVYPTDVVARAYAGIAGLLNLLCMFDATALAMMGTFGEPSRKRKTGTEEG